jgi:predicted dienelactone hydrolase
MASSDATVVLERQSPLIVLIHGSGGSADSMAWIATELAKRGVLVVAADHPTSSGGDPERASIVEVWTQPEDVSHLIDQLLESDWKDFIDPKRIGVIGFSLGGAAAMSLAGTRFRIEQFVQFCQKHSDGACRALSHHFEGRDSRFYYRANGDMTEHRIRAAAAIAPGFTESVTEESIRSLSTPLLLIVGLDDPQLPPATHITSAWNSLPAHSEIVEFDETQHFSFLPLCRDDAITVLAETGEEFVCQESGRKSREQIHQATIKILDQFFKDTGVLARNGDAS